MRVKAVPVARAGQHVMRQHRHMRDEVLLGVEEAKHNIYKVVTYVELKKTLSVAIGAEPAVLSRSRQRIRTHH